MLEGQPQTPVLAGGRLHGQVKSGNTPLPGVTVTAQNTLTGKRFSTTTDITGAWTIAIAQNGRYVIRTQFAAFAPGAEESVLNAARHDQTVNFELILASRAKEQQDNESASQLVSSSAIRQLAARGAQNLSLMSALAAGTETQAGSIGAAGVCARTATPPATKIPATTAHRMVFRRIDAPRHFTLAPIQTAFAPQRFTVFRFYMDSSNRRCVDSVHLSPGNRPA
jgi:hypothetical protein